MNHRRFHAMAAIIALAVSVAACREQRAPGPPANATPARAPEATPETPTASIIRPEIAPEPAEPVPPSPLEATIDFPDGGHVLDEEAEEVLRGVLDSEQLAEGWPVVLRGHGDSAGTDEANLRVSRLRAEAVAEWLVEQGVDEKRITVIAFGGQNPIAPNALPDGTPDEAGRARNRRVAISIAPPAKTGDAEDEDDGAQGATADTA